MMCVPRLNTQHFFLSGSHSLVMRTRTEQEKPSVVFHSLLCVGRYLHVLVGAVIVLVVVAHQVP